MIAVGAHLNACARGKDAADRAGRLLACQLAARYSPPIGHADLFLTENCNHRCSYCFVAEKNEHARLALSTGRDAIGYLTRASRDLPEIRVLLFGGEPLLEFELITELVSYGRTTAAASGKKIGFDMTTNGMT
jgi:uncharacterized protein